MRVDRGAVIIVGALVLVAWSQYSAVTASRARAPWSSGAIERRIASRPELTGIVTDRHGVVLARPVAAQGGWVIERPLGRPLAVAGVGRTMLQPHGIQGNLADTMRAGGATLRPYGVMSPWLRRLIGDPILTAPSMPTITTTLDARLQERIYEWLAPLGPKSAAVVMDARTGELHAVVDYPGPDVNSSAAPDARTSLDSLHGVNLPASTMKVLSAAYILETRPADARRSHQCDGQRCWTPHGTVRDLRDAIVRSCNTWFRRESARWPRDEWLAFVLASGLQPAETPGLPVTPIVFDGHVDNQMHWPQAVGQQVWVSLVGLAGAFATLTGQDGRRVNPLVVQGAGPRPGPVVVRPEVSARVREMLRDTVRKGTARSLTRTYRAGDAGAKTGTGQREGRESDAVFVAVAPWDRPLWVVVVSVKGGGRGASLGATAGWTLLAASEATSATREGRSGGRFE